MFFDCTYNRFVGEMFFERMMLPRVIDKKYAFCDYILIHIVGQE